MRDTRDSYNKLAPIRVVSGLHHANGKIVMGKRKLIGLRPGLWELPGGKVDYIGDYEEEPRKALAREWEEELGHRIDSFNIGPLLASATLETELTFVVELYPIYNLPKGAELRPIVHDELQWVDPLDAVTRYPCSPAFYLHYRAIISWIAWDRRPR